MAQVTVSGRLRRKQDLEHGIGGHFLCTPEVFSLGAETVFPILMASLHSGFHSLSPVRRAPTGSAPSHDFYGSSPHEREACGFPLTIRMGWGVSLIPVFR